MLISEVAYETACSGTVDINLLDELTNRCWATSKVTSELAPAVAVAVIDLLVTELANVRSELKVLNAEKEWLKESVLELSASISSAAQDLDKVIHQQKQTTETKQQGITVNTGGRKASYWRILSTSVLRRCSLHHREINDTTAIGWLSQGSAKAVNFPITNTRKAKHGRTRNMSEGGGSVGSFSAEGDKLMVSAPQSPVAKKRSNSDYRFDSPRSLPGDFPLIIPTLEDTTEGSLQHSLQEIRSESPFSDTQFDSSHPLWCDIGDQNIDSPAFDVRILDNLPRGDILRVVGLCIFGRYKFWENPAVNKEAVSHILKLIGIGYNEAPYHNELHAADVMQTAHVLISAGGYKYLTDTDVLALLLSAAIHDYGHPGINNQFIAQLYPGLATLWGRAVVESYHVSASRDYVDKMFAAFSVTDMHAWDVVNVLVLSTDISCHFDILKHWEVYPSKQTFMKLLLHGADISNPVKELQVFLFWTRRVMTEFWSQGEEQKSMGFQISSMCDINDTDIPSVQVSFINVIVSPVFKSLSNVLNIETQIFNLDASLSLWGSSSARTVVECCIVRNYYTKYSSETRNKEVKLSKNARKLVDWVLQLSSKHIKSKSIAVGPDNLLANPRQSGSCIKKLPPLVFTAHSDPRAHVAEVADILRRIISRAIVQPGFVDRGAFGDPLTTSKELACAKSDVVRNVVKVLISGLEPAIQNVITIRIEKYLKSRTAHISLEDVQKRVF